MSSAKKKKPASNKVVVQPHKQALLTRLKRIEGQVRGVANMVEEDRYCIDILTQVAALRSALDAVSLRLLEDHSRHCLSHAIKQGNDEEAIAELLQVVKRMTK